MRAVFFVLLLLPFAIPVLVDDAFAAKGDITAVIAQSSGNNFEYDDADGLYNSLVQVDSDTFALAYRGTDADGFISTFNISSDGTTITKLHTIEHDTEFAWDNSLIKVDSDTFALAYGGDNGGFGRPAGFISTFTIDSDGTITPIRIQNHAAFASASANLEHDTNEGSVNSLVHVNDDTYALSYERNGLFLQITTFTISSDGATITELDTLNQDATNCNDKVHQSLVKVDSDTVARAYCGSGGDGYLRTFSIAENGDITKKSTYEFDTSGGTNHFLVQIDSDTIAVAYQNAEVSGGRVTERNGVIKTFTINSSDEISEADSLEHHSGTNSITGNSEDNFLVKVDSDTFALAYDDGYAGNDGFISTFTIDSDGTITGLRTANGGDNLEHDTSHSTDRSLVKVDSNTVALAYGGTDLDGFISTFTIGDSDDSTSTESKKRSGACGFDRDCTAPRITKHGISETPDGFSINNVIFEENQKFYNENPTVEIGIGELTTIKTRAWENMGPEKIFLAIAYLDMQEAKPNWQDSEAYIEYDIRNDSITIHDENKLFLAQASTEIVKDPYGDNQGLEFLDITFSLMFTKPMETSHVAIQVVDHIRNYELVYFKDALKVVDRPISEMPEFPGKIEKANTTPKHDEDIHFVLAVNGTEDTIFAAVDGHVVPIEEMNKEEPKIETSEERDARYHLKVKQSDQYERLLEYIAESQALHPEAWDKIVGTDNVSNQMEHVTDGTKTNVIKNDRRR
tara:strand:- start:97 stop:2319 length:2223 start_codon:yes stop_codon:yes gene_type:complete